MLHFEVVDVVVDESSRSAKRVGKFFTPVIVLALLAAIGTGCAGDGPPPPIGGSSTTTSLAGGSLLGPLQQQVFTPSCAIPGCHDAITSISGLDLSSTDDSFNDLVGVTSLCAGKLRVVSGDVDASYLVDKVGDGAPFCGTLMPLGLPQLDASELQLIRNWIAQGAPPADSNVFVVTTTTTVADATSTTVTTTTTTTVE